MWIQTEVIGFVFKCPTSWPLPCNLNVGRVDINWREVNSKIVGGTTFNFLFY